MRTLAGLLFTALLLSGCGKKGPLIYPDMLVPAAPSDVTAQQSGNSIRLAFTLPAKERSGRPLSAVAGARIFKRDLLSGQDPGCAACTSDFSLFKKLYLDVPDGIQQTGNRVVLLDGAVLTGRSYSYTVSVFSKDGLDGASSPPVTTDMVQPPLPPVVRAKSQPTEVNLEFDGLPLEGRLVGYSLYRTVKGEPFGLLAYTSSPVTAQRYTDVGLDRGVTYLYAAKSVVLLSSGAIVESGLSNQVEATLKEDE